MLYFNIKKDVVQLEYFPNDIRRSFELSYIGHLFFLADLQISVLGVYNGQMFEEIKSLKDSSNSSNLPGSNKHFSMSYNKTNKLVTALYMVTDIMDSDEPIRTSLRSLGTGVVSDIHTLRTSIGFNLTVQIEVKIESILSFLEIASAVGMISSMNCGILQKEFLELQGSLRESKQSSTL